MSTSYSPVNVSGGVSTQTTINQNLTDIQTALSRQLNRYGDTGTGSNIMLVDLDMNSNDILNAGTVYAADIVIAGVSLMTSVNAAAASAAAALASQIAAAASAANAAASAITAAASAASIVSFANISVATQSTVVADSATDTLTLVAGTNIGITTNAGTDTITITNTATPISTFLGLTDTPDNYTAKGSKLVQVKDDATGLDFIGKIETASPYNIVLGSGTAGAALAASPTNIIIGRNAASALSNGAGANCLIGDGIAPSLTTGALNACIGSGISLGSLSSNQVAIGANSIAQGIQSVIIGVNANDAGYDYIVALGYQNNVTSANYDFTVSANNKQIIKSNMDTGVFRITGQLQHTAVNKTGTYTAAKENIITCDASGGAFFIYLPAVATSAHRNYTIKKIDASANTVTVDANGVANIDGALTFSLISQYDFVTVQCNAAGTAWFVVSRNSTPAAPAFRGVLAYMSVGQSVTSGTGTYLSFDSESYDTDAIHDNGVNPERLTVPAGVSKVRLVASVAITYSAAATLRLLNLEKNASVGYTGPVRARIATTGVDTGSTELSFSSPVLTVVPRA